jgi:hypothetical protein
MKKIITSRINPPIPTSKYDWEAVFDDYEEGDFIGWGATEQDAIDDLLNQEKAFWDH